jgi:hypothetical protein
VADEEDEGRGEGVVGEVPVVDVLVVRRDSAGDGTRGVLGLRPGRDEMLRTVGDGVAI